MSALPKVCQKIPPIVSVGVRSKERADSMEYMVNPSGATISRELFHLMGLVDEYQESEKGCPTGSLSKPKLWSSSMLALGRLFT